MKLTTAQIKELPDSVFGLPSERKYPMPDKEHVIKAIQFFSYCKKSQRKELAGNISRRARELDMKVGVNPKNIIRRYLDKDILKESANTININYLTVVNESYVPEIVNMIDKQIEWSKGINEPEYIYSNYCDELNAHINISNGSIKSGIINVVNNLLKDSQDVRFLTNSNFKTDTPLRKNNNFDSDTAIITPLFSYITNTIHSITSSEEYKPNLMEFLSVLAPIFDKRFVINRLYEIRNVYMNIQAVDPTYKRICDFLTNLIIKSEGFTTLHPMPTLMVNTINNIKKIDTEGYYFKYLESLPKGQKFDNYIEWLGDNKYFKELGERTSYNFSDKDIKFVTSKLVDSITFDLCYSLEQIVKRDDEGFRDEKKWLFVGQGSDDIGIILLMLEKLIQYGRIDGYHLLDVSNQVSRNKIFIKKNNSIYLMTKPCFNRDRNENGELETTRDRDKYAIYLICFHKIDHPDYFKNLIYYLNPWGDKNVYKQKNKWNLEWTKFVVEDPLIINAIELKELEEYFENMDDIIARNINKYRVEPVESISAKDCFGDYESRNKHHDEQSVFNLVTEGISINKEGDVSFLFSNDETLMGKYDRIHKSLMINKQSDNIEAMKHDLAYLFAMVVMIENKYTKNKNADKKSDEYEDAIKARMFAINDIKTNLKYINKKDKDFNFMEYYEKNDFDKSIYTFKGESIQGLKKIFKLIMM